MGVITKHLCIMCVGEGRGRGIPQPAVLKSANPTAFNPGKPKLDLQSFQGLNLEALDLCRLWVQRLVLTAIPRAS